MMRSQDRRVTRQVIEIVHNDRHEQIQHLSRRTRGHPFRLEHGFHEPETRTGTRMSRSKGRQSSIHISVLRERLSNALPS